MTLRNRTAQSITLAWFMEADFDLDGSGGQDMLTGDTHGIFQFTPTTMVRVTSTLTPNAFQIAPFPDLFLSLGDLSFTNLNNTGGPFGPGDGTFAFQWSVDIPPNGSISYGIDKDFVPEPGTSTLFALALAILGIRQGWLRGAQGRADKPHYSRLLVTRAVLDRNQRLSCPRAPSG